MCHFVYLTKDKLIKGLKSGYYIKLAVEFFLTHRIYSEDVFIVLKLICIMLSGNTDSHKEKTFEVIP